MKLLEIRNNLVKLEFDESEKPILGKFITLTAEDKSYVAQIINLKSDGIMNFLIAKLIFTFTNDGIVDNYDGSVPSMLSDATFLASDELIDLLPVESPIKFGNIAQENSMLSVDMSVFESNFAVFSEHDFEKQVFISNCVRQLFYLKEKTVVIDISDIFDGYNTITPGKDFKFPLNSDMIDYIFEYELSALDASTRAVIQEIFYEVSQYIKTLDEKFLPIDKFIEVVSAQYKELQMPELALLKNKLLKYRDANIFANTIQEVAALESKLKERNCSIINLKDCNDKLQQYAISYIHNILNNFDKYVYMFVSLNDENSNKKSLKQFINSNHVFTTIFASHSYKYVTELKEHAENMLFFAPQSMRHDFASYNTFLNKLNYGEAILYGKLTQGVPFIIDISELDLPLTFDDVFGEKNVFVPAAEDELFSDDSFSDKDEEHLVDIPNNDQETEEILEPEYEDIGEMLNFNDEAHEEIEMPESEEETSDNIILPTENIMDEYAEDEFQEEDNSESYAELSENENSELTMDDLDFIEDNQEEDSAGVELEDMVDDTLDEENNSQIVPVYPADDDMNFADEGIDFVQGDTVTHPRYGKGVIEKIIKYGNKTLCSISFENVGRRLLDPSVSEFEKV